MTNFNHKNFSPVDGELALSIIDKVLEFYETNGYKPSDESLLGTLYYTTFAYWNKHQTHPDKYAEEIQEKIWKIKKLPTYEQTQLKEATKRMINRKAGPNAVDIERFFPRAKLVRAIFGEQEYQRMMTQKDNELAIKMFAEYLDDTLFETASGIYGSVDRAIALLELGAGIGITTKMKKQIEDGYKHDKLEKPTAIRKSTIDHGWLPDGLHPRDLTFLYNLTESRVRQIHDQQIQRLRDNKKLHMFFEHALNGNIEAMIAMLPPKKQQIYKFQQEHKMSDVPTDELNATGKWLADNMRFDR